MAKSKKKSVPKDRLLLFPPLEWVFCQEGVVEAPCARNLVAKPRWRGDLLVATRQLDLGNYKSFVFALELIYLEGVALVLDDMAHLVDNTTTSAEQSLRHAERNLALPLEATQPSVTALALEGEDTFIIAYTHTSSNLATAEIALSNTHRATYRPTPRLVCG